MPTKKLVASLAVGAAAVAAGFAVNDIARAAPHGATSVPPDQHAELVTGTQAQQPQQLPDRYRDADPVPMPTPGTGAR